MTTAVKESDLAAYNRTLRMDDAELVRQVRDLLGGKLTAYIGGVKSTRSVSQWVDGTATIRSDEARARLGLAYRAASLINERDSIRVVQAWFQGMNPMLNDRAPARVLVESAPDSPDASLFLAAARKMAALG